MSSWRVMRESFDYFLAGGAYAFTKFLRLNKMPPNLTPLQDVEQLSPLVCRVLGQNPGSYTLQGTNTYLVGSGNKKVLIDTGEPNVLKYVEKLTDALTNSEISCIIATHHHADHVGGIAEVLRICADVKTPVYKIRRTDGTKDVDAEQYTFIEDGHEVSVEGATLRVIHTPGHTCDHISLLLKEENALFSGDCVLGEGTTVFEDLHSYMNSLAVLRQLNSSRIYPGHGPVIESPSEKLDEYIAHRNQREEQIMEYLKGVDSASPMAITNAIYKDIPLDVKLGAVGNVKHHLSKLVKDGMVIEIGGGNYQALSKPGSSNF
ncbi:metallo-beta-lactamase superfamily domain-containing protein [Ditylenchus destructor]|uniref:Beta-lactamase-like protein 2 homolog n=1 Tax=Ditylenchus destructor TaxID=166010 RepID=A0AAD4QVP3_9BILA|nr:metallo-beta-lactamase superfamily domain-containing protein [Ditylenchus destructor]